MGRNTRDDKVVLVSFCSMSNIDIGITIHIVTFEFLRVHVSQKKVFIADFGLARMYKRPSTDEHIPCRSVEL